MPTLPATYSLSDGNWTLIADYSAAVDQPRLVRVTNTGAAGEILFAPAHLAPSATPEAGDDGLTLAADSEIEIGAVRPGNGNVLQVWAKGNGMAGIVGVVL
jgi:hypothetical protein